MTPTPNSSSQPALNHAFTPPELAEFNAVLNVALAADVIDELLIEKIIDQRANLVESLLNNLDEQQKRCFAAYEMKSNDAILAAVTERRRQLKAKLGKVSKASKGIKKYHQV